MRLKIFGVQFADARRDHRPAGCATTFSGPTLALQELVRMLHDPQCRAGRQSRQIQETAQDYSGFWLSPKHRPRNRHNSPRARPCARQAHGSKCPTACRSRSGERRDCRIIVNDVNEPFGAHCLSGQRIHHVDLGWHRVHGPRVGARRDHALAILARSSEDGSSP